MVNPSNTQGLLAWALQGSDRPVGPLRPDEERDRQRPGLAEGAEAAVGSPSPVAAVIAAYPKIAAAVLAEAELRVQCLLPPGDAEDDEPEHENVWRAVKAVADLRAELTS